MLFQARFGTAVWTLTLALGAALLSPIPAQAAATATLVGGQLQVTGDGADDLITVRLLAGDTTQLEVLSGVAVVGTFARAAVTSILVNGGAGADVILVSEVNGAFTDTIPTTLQGGDGTDTITGGTGGETIDGGPGDDILLGGPGVDVLSGGDGNDSITGGTGSDQHFGGAGNDVMVWNPGDGSDLMEGQDGTDTMLFNGSAGAEIMAAVPNGARVTFTRNLGNIVMDLGTVEQITVNGLAGADTISADPGLSAALVFVIDGGDDADTITGGPGNDTISGGAADDILNGGGGNDTLTGNTGADQHFGNTGDDVMVWNPGDGNDLMEGGDGTDTMLFNGSGAAEIMAAVPAGARVTFTRNLGNIIMDLGTIERIAVNGLAGDDTITADPGLSATLAFVVDGGDDNDTITGGPGNDTLNGGAGIDTLNGGGGNDTLTGGPGNDSHAGNAGDDVMVWNPGDGNDLMEGGDGADTMLFSGSGAAEIMAAVPNGQRVTFTRNLGNIVMDLGTVEVIAVNGLAGADSVTADPTLSPQLSFVIDGGDDDDILTGGPGPDTIRGGNGVDTLNGGGGNDTLIGGPGNDPHFGGDGDDTMVWNPGDGNDTMDGEAGFDTMLFNGSAGSEIMVAVANAQRITFTRNLGNIVMNVGTTEQFTINGLGGDDSITIPAGLAVLTTVIIDAGPGADTVSTVAGLTSTINGGTEADILNFDAGGQAASLLSNTIQVGGLTRATFAAVETVNVLNTPSALPTVTIVSPTTDPATTVVTPFINLAGTAADDGGVTSVAFSNDRGGSGTAVGTTSWEAANVPLQPGANVITVTATDTNGNRASDTITVTVTSLTYYLAEGATGSFFDTDLLLANPNGTPAPVVITYIRGNGTTVTQNVTLAATSQQRIAVDALAGLEATELSASVSSTSGLPIVVERTQLWDPTGYGSHTEKATSGPATTWYFAEGSQGFFDTYVLLANPGGATNTATVQFLLETGAPVTRTYDLLPTSRRTIHAGSIAELVNRSFGIVVTFTAPGVAERAMYFGTPLFNGGHESAGVNAPATSWFLAEGATGTFFTTFLLLANPGTTAATVTVTYLPASGGAVTRTKNLPANSRLTVNIATEDATLADAAVATAVQSTAPILVERAQYWPFAPAQWQEAHNSFGATAVGTTWGLAEGRVGLDRAFQTYILLANADPAQSAQVQVTFLRGNGTTVVKTYAVNPSSRFNVHVNSMVPELQNETFGTVVEVTNGVGIFVERALYSDASGVVWAAGTNALATRLP